jgi:hypothetical protein
MGILVKLRNYRERRAYERSVKIREKYQPYGVMYGKIVAYQRSSQPPAHSNGHSEPAKAHDDMKQNAKRAFMTHPGATDEDFERCWPAIRDEIFKTHTLRKLEIVGRVEESRNGSH